MTQIDLSGMLAESCAKIMIKMVVVNGYLRGL